MTQRRGGQHLPGPTAVGGCGPAGASTLHFTSAPCTISYRRGDGGRAGPGAGAGAGAGAGELLSATRRTSSPSATPPMFSAMVARTTRPDVDVERARRTLLPAAPVANRSRVASLPPRVAPPLSRFVASELVNNCGTARLLTTRSPFARHEGCAGVLPDVVGAAAAAAAFTGSMARIIGARRAWARVVLRAKRYF